VRVTLVAGQPRQGKSTLALAVARQDHNRIIVLDPVRSPALSSVRGVSSWVELAKWLVSPPASGDRWEIALRSPNPADYVETLRYAEHYRFVVLLVDEVLTFTSDREALPWLVKVARTGANFGGGAGVMLILTAQRPYDIPPDVRACMTRLLMFATREPGDLEYISRFTLDPELAERVAGLAPHKHLEFPPPPSEKETTEDESVLSRGTRSGRAVGGVPDGPKAEPDSSPPGRAEVALTHD